MVGVVCSVLDKYYNALYTPCGMTGSAGNSASSLAGKIGNWVGSHYPQIGTIAGIAGLAISLFNVVFGVRLTPYGNAFAAFVSANSFQTFLLLSVLVSQVFLYQRVAWIVEQLEEQGYTEETSESDEGDELLTDGGDSNLPSRDSKGRFTTDDSGGSNLLLILLAGTAGYVVGGQSTAIDPIAGALIGIMTVSILQAVAGNN
jgi:hypothetical protein